MNVRSMVFVALLTTVFLYWQTVPALADDQSLKAVVDAQPIQGSSSSGSESRLCRDYPKTDAPAIPSDRTDLTYWTPVRGNPIDTVNEKCSEIGGDIQECRDTIKQWNTHLNSLHCISAGRSIIVPKSGRESKSTVTRGQDTASLQQPVTLVGQYADASQGGLRNFLAGALRAEFNNLRAVLLAALTDHVREATASSEIAPDETKRSIASVWAQYIQWVLLAALMVLAIFLAICLYRQYKRLKQLERYQVGYVEMFTIPDAALDDESRKLNMRKKRIPGMVIAIRINKDGTRRREMSAPCGTPVLDENFVGHVINHSECYPEVQRQYGLGIKPKAKVEPLTPVGV